MPIWKITSPWTTRIVKAPTARSAYDYYRNMITRELGAFIRDAEPNLIECLGTLAK